MSGIVIDGVTKVYTGGVKAIDDVTLDIADGEFMVLVGPSGCGKSTLLRSIAGLEDVTEGNILIGDRDVTYLPPRSRDVAMVFQNYALYPHMDVRDNLGFGLRVRHTDKKERAKRVEAVASVLGLGPLLDRRPAQLSGGQRQRVAIGRAMVREPQAFLMDEPLSNLDAKLRVEMRAELARLHERLATTTVYVTHDQVEAMTLGQRVAVLRDGVLQQCATPQQLFDAPVNLFVAAFIGSPSMNLVEATLSGGAAAFAGHTLPLAQSSPLSQREGRVILGIRPSDLALAGPSTNGQPRLRVEIEAVEELGSERNLLFRVEAPRVATEAITAASSAREDDDAQLLVDERARFVARIVDRRPVVRGDVVELAVDVDRVHAFTLEDELAIRP